MSHKQKISKISSKVGFLNVKKPSSQSDASQNTVTNYKPIRQHLETRNTRSSPKLKFIAAVVNESAADKLSNGKNGISVKDLIISSTSTSEVGKDQRQSTSKFSIRDDSLKPTTSRQHRNETHERTITLKGKNVIEKVSGFQKEQLKETVNNNHTPNKQPDETVVKGSDTAKKILKRSNSDQDCTVLTKKTFCDLNEGDASFSYDKGCNRLRKRRHSKSYQQALQKCPINGCNSKGHLMGKYEHHYTHKNCPMFYNLTPKRCRQNHEAHNRIKEDILAMTVNSYRDEEQFISENEAKNK